MSYDDIQELRRSADTNLKEDIEKIEDVQELSDLGDCRPSAREQPRSEGVLSTITNVLAQWGVETNGYVSSLFLVDCEAELGP